MPFSVTSKQPSLLGLRGHHAVEVVTLSEITLDVILSEDYSERWEELELGALSNINKLQKLHHTFCLDLKQHLKF